MNSVWCDGVQPTGASGRTSSPVVGSTSHGVAVALPPVCVRCGCPAAAMAAGLLLVWSSIRLLATRTSESMTVPVLDLYDVGPGAPTGSDCVIGSASRKNGVVSRGKIWLDAPKKFGSGLPANGPLGCPGAWTPVAAFRLLQEPSTVRRPYDVRTSGTCSLSGMPSPGWASRVPHGFDAVSVVLCRSAILICLRMNDRSPGVTTKSLPTGAGAAVADCTIPIWSPSPTTTASALNALTLRRSPCRRRARGALSPNFFETLLNRPLMAAVMTHQPSPCYERQTQSRGVRLEIPWEKVKRSSARRRLRR